MPGAGGIGNPLPSAGQRLGRGGRLRWSRGVLERLRRSGLPLSITSKPSPSERPWFIAETPPRRPQRGDKITRSLFSMITRHDKDGSTHSRSQPHLIRDVPGSHSSPILLYPAGGRGIQTLLHGFQGFLGSPDPRLMPNSPRTAPSTCVGRKAVGPSHIGPSRLPRSARPRHDRHP